MDDETRSAQERPGWALWAALAGALIIAGGALVFLTQVSDGEDNEVSAARSDDPAQADPELLEWIEGIWYHEADEVELPAQAIIPGDDLDPEEQALIEARRSAAEQMVGSLEPEFEEATEQADAVVVEMTEIWMPYQARFEDPEVPESEVLEAFVAENEEDLRALRPAHEATMDRYEDLKATTNEIGEQVDAMTAEELAEFAP